MDDHYIISTKHTCTKDPVLTFWRQNSRGYCWFIEWAGLYSIPENQNPKSDQNTERRHGSVYVTAEALQPLLKKAIYEGKEFTVLPNNDAVRKALKIALTEYQQKHKQAFQNHFKFL